MISNPCSRQLAVRSSQSRKKKGVCESDWVTHHIGSYLCAMEKFLKDLFADQSYDEKNFFLIAGPCVVESEELIMEVADKVSGICKNLGIPYIFKASYRKANRTSGSFFHRYW